jgi:hypothetical protein
MNNFQKWKYSDLDNFKKNKFQISTNSKFEQILNNKKIQARTNFENVNKIPIWIFFEFE